MARTAQEEQELQALLKEAQDAQAIEQSKLPKFAQPMGSSQSNRTPEEEQELSVLLAEAAETEAGRPTYAQPTERTSEAELGTLNRLQYAIEPLESNRRQFLINKFGNENVLEDDKGEVYIKQEGEIRPVNQVGFSQADIAELVGASPEILATAAGSIGGGLLGSVVPGAGTVAGAAAGGAAAGAAGSGIRQAASALFTDVPQVAGAGERATEVALSGGLGAVGGITANVAGKVVKGMLKTIAPKLGKRALQVEATSAKFGLPSPTTGQKFGGILERQEKILAETPFFGRKIRRQLQNQSDEITNVLKKEIGDFTGTELAAEDAGNRIKQVSTEKIKALKSAAGELFEDFTKGAKGINLDANITKNDFINKLSKLNLFDGAGNPTAFNPAKTGLPKAEFERVQSVVKPLLDAFDTGTVEEAGKRTITVDAINNLRKSLDGDIKIFQREGLSTGVDDRVLLQAREAFMDTVESGLKRAEPGLKSKFKAARVIWKDAKDQEKIINKLGIDIGNPKEIADEKVLNKVFSDTKSFEAFNKVVGKKSSTEAAEKFTEDLLRKAATGEKVSAAKLLSNIDKKQFVLKRAMGKDKINNLIELLEFAKQNNIPVNPSMTEITNIQGSSIKTLGTGISLKTFLGIVDGSLKAPKLIKKGVAGTVQAAGQEKKRKATFKREQLNKLRTGGR